MKAFSLIFAYFCINMAIWTLNLLGLLPTALEATIDPSSVEGLFNLTTFAGITGVVGGATIGIASLVTRSYALGTGVLLIWIVGILFKPISDVFTGLPRLTSAVLAPAGTLVSQAVGQVTTAFAAIILFIFIVEVIAGRQIT